ncbi:Glutathione transport system permease protein GsiC [Anaerolineae bacterium]|nr:Glutathione transport system permease protein GsiC [Anaerolineae bacterium]
MLTRFAVKVVIQLVLVLGGVSTALFFLLRLSGDPASTLAGPAASPEIIAALRQEMGLTDPIWIQYLRFLEHAIQLDFGNSYRFTAPALPLVLARMPATLILASSVIVLSILISFPAGVWSALRPGSIAAKLIYGLSYTAQAIPGFWLALLLIIVFAVRLRWLPSFGADTPAQLVLPTLTLAPLLTARITLMLNDSVRRVLDEDYIRTARAKGLVPRIVLVRHIIRNALISVVTLIGIEFAHLSGGAVITEVIYSWPGIGSFLVEGVLARDYAIVQACVFVIALVVMVINLGVELSYGFLDPRIRTA